MIRKINSGLAFANDAVGAVVGFPLGWMRIRKNHQERFWTTPTCFSLSRIPLAILTAWFLHAGQNISAALVFIIIMITDKLDGEYAKRQGTTWWGGFMDPLCDKVSVFICCSQCISQMKFWPAVSLGSIEFSLFVAPLLVLLKDRRDVDVKSTLPGKWKFGIECVMFLAFLGRFDYLGNALLLLAIPFAIVSAVCKIYEITHQL